VGVRSHGGDGPNGAYIHERLQGKILEVHSFRGDESITIPRNSLLDVFRFLKEDPKLDFNFLTDITAVDYLGKKTPRFEVVYHLYSLSLNHRLRVKVPVPEEDPAVDSLTPLWKGANWLEREVWDMFGVRFRGHPDLRRVLMYEQFQGHPLRKDYPVNQRHPLVPEREVDDTFVDGASQHKLAHLKGQFPTKA